MKIINDKHTKTLPFEFGVAGKRFVTLVTLKYLVVDQHRGAENYELIKFNIRRGFFSADITKVTRSFGAFLISD